MGRDGAIHRKANTGRATESHTGASGLAERLTEESRFNHHRLLEPIGYIPPAEAEANYWRQQTQASAATKPAQSAALQEG